MMIFGFELEGFYFEDFDSVSRLSIPPKEYPRDGFPGLVEVRNSRPNDLFTAYAEILITSLKYPGVCFKTNSVIFNGEQRAELRRRYESKSAWDIQNIYGRPPRLLGNRTIASFQINMSNRTREGHWDTKDKIWVPDTYALFDIPRVIRALDKEFAEEIRAANRQPGEYAIKDNLRLEYRSLPNSVFETEPSKIKRVLARIEGAVGK